MTVDTAVLIGRFQPFHSAHLGLLRQALEIAPQCVVVIGSAHQARTPKNPFTWTERAEMIRLAVPAEDRARLRFLPVRDYYDLALWTRVVRDGVTALAAEANGSRAPRVGLVGHLKDATSEYLRGFQGWDFLSLERLPGADGTSVREALFAGDAEQPEATLAALIDQVPPTTLAFLRAWMALSFHAAMKLEWRMLREYWAAWASAPYPPVFVTVDAVVRRAGHVLLIRRGRPPGVGLYAVPGGFIDQRETVYQSAVRELREETHMYRPDHEMLACLRATVVFDHPDRSLRGRTITHAHYFDLGDGELPEVRADDDAQSAEWMPIERLPALEDRFHDDHFHMLDHFLGVTGGSRG